MTRIAPLALLMLLPGLAAAQELRSGPNAPAVSSQIPPTASPPAGTAPGQATGDARTGSTEMRVAPPADHRVLGGPPVPGATQPERSEGFTTSRDPIPPNIGEQIRPGASTTGR